MDDHVSSINLHREINMQQLTNAGQNIVSDIARRYNLSQDAIIHMLVAVNNGAGSMAQFYCPELGGNGQWMRGGMTMVGDMFNHALKAKSRLGKTGAKLIDLALGFTPLDRLLTDKDRADPSLLEI